MDYFSLFQDVSFSKIITTISAVALPIVAITYFIRNLMQIRASFPGLPKQGDYSTRAYSSSGASPARPRQTPGTMQSQIISKIKEFEEKMRSAAGNANTARGGADMAALALKGYSNALAVAQQAPAPESESTAEYFARLTGMLEKCRDEFLFKQDDNDGGGACAVMDIIIFVKDLEKEF
jgi:hypothetical protein